MAERGKAAGKAATRAAEGIVGRIAKEGYDDVTEPLAREATETGAKGASKARSWAGNPQDWNRNGVDLPHGYPEAKDFPIMREVHVLDGDLRGGGHRHGTGIPGKSEFPADWPDEKILAACKDVARNPDATPAHQDNGRWRAMGIRDGVPLTVVMQPDGTLWTGWPGNDMLSWPRNRS